MNNRSKTCKIDVVSVSLRFALGSDITTFDEILKHPDINEKEKIINQKTIHFSVLEDNDDYLIGFVRSTIDKDLPAKINRRTKIVSALDVNNDEGIAYGNILLYSKKLNVLFYEINKNSIYLDLFHNYIFKCFHDSITLKDEYIFDINFGTIFRKNEYERALRMGIYKSFKMKVYQPRALLREITQINSSLEDRVELDFLPEIQSAAELNSEYAEIEFAVRYPKKTGGLYKNKVEPIIRNLGKLLGYNQIRQNINSIEVTGYNNSAGKMIPIDLVGDVYFTTFKIDIPRLDSNLQKQERINQIKIAYEREFPILENYL